MPPAPEPLHLLIPDAVPATGFGAPAADAPAPPQLDALLARMRPSSQIEAGIDSPATPFEIALADANNLPGAPGRRPWAAFEAGIVGTPCAWLKPCHWQLGLDHVAVLDPGALGLTETESRALLETVQALVTEDGITLRYATPDAWLAQGELFRGLTTWSIARAVAQPLTREQLAVAPTDAQSAHLRRLQAEWQMLLYQHPVNEAREAARRWPVNALWITGAGALDHALTPNPHVLVEPRLAQLPPEAGTAERDAAWLDVAKGTLTRLRAVLDAGGNARLTLCGPRRAIGFTPGRGPAFKMSSLFRPQRWKELREQL